MSNDKHQKQTAQQQQKPAAVQAPEKEAPVKQEAEQAPVAAKTGDRQSVSIAAPKAPLKKTVSPIDRLEERLRAYCERSAPNVRMDKEERKAHHLELASIVLTLSRFASSSFKGAMSRTVAVAREYRDTAFNERLVAQGIIPLESIGRISKEERILIENFLNLILTAADSSDGVSVKGKIDLERMIDSMPGEDLGGKLSSYFR